MSLRFYEAVVALKPETPEEKQKQLFKQAQEIISKASGQIHHVDVLGSLALANAKKNSRAVYFHMSYKALGEAVKACERLFKITDFVLYFHHERLSSKHSLDEHQKVFESVLEKSRIKEEERQVQRELKRKKIMMDHRESFS